MKRILTVSRHETTRSRGASVDVGPLAPAKPGAAPGYWLHIAVDDEDGPSERWRDTRECPALRGAILALGAIRVPALDIASAGTEARFLLTRHLYTIESPARSEDGGPARVLISMRDGSADAHRIDAFFDALRACESGLRP